MSLKFKRYFPILLLLVAILSFLAFAMGDQPIAAYSVQATSQPSGGEAATSFNSSCGFAWLVGKPASQSVYIASQGGGTGETSYAISELVGTELL